jgi:hypothetical protein
LHLPTGRTPAIAGMGPTTASDALAGRSRVDGPNLEGTLELTRLMDTLVCALPLLVLLVLGVGDVRTMGSAVAIGLTSSQLQG